MSRSPQTAARLVEKFVVQDHVNFILGPYGSANAATAAAVVERLQVPMVEGNGAAEKIFTQGFKYTFAVLSPARRYLAGHPRDGAAPRTRSRKTVAIATANDAFSVEVGARRGRLRRPRTA